MVFFEYLFYLVLNSSKMYTVSKNGQVCVWDCSIDLEALVPEEKSSKEVINLDEEDNIVSKEDGKLLYLFLLFND